MPDSRQWVPLFATRSSSPLETSTPLPLSRRSSHQHSPLMSDDEPAHPGAYDERRGLSSSVSPAVTRSEWISSPDLAASILLQRGASSNGTAATTSASQYLYAGHARKRSTSSIAAQAMFPEGKSAGMERLPSLTSMMAQKEGRLRAGIPKSKGRKALLGPVFFFRTALLLIFLVGLIQVGRWGFLGSAAEDLVTPRVPSQLVTTFDWEGAPILSPLHIPSWYDRLLAQSISSSFPKHETWAYSTKTHPRTPKPSDKIQLADYLTTRLGSHFSTPSSGTPTHLWLTTASKSSIRVSTRHLEAFVAGLDRKGRKLNEEAVEAAEKAEDEDDEPVHESTIVAENLEARRALVVLCLDEGCMDYCRQRDWYCFGGFRELTEEVKGDGYEKVRERVKLQGIIETLESGRRIFVVDTDVYFRDDPVPYLGLLDEYDIQLPDSWSTTNIHAGFIYLNPTKNVISLWRKILDLRIRQGPSTDDNLVHPNLLLDPKGVPRVHQKTPVSSSTDSDGVVLDDVYVDEAVEGGYGQSQFRSAWGGGTDVKVLDRKRFRSSTGRDGGSFGGAMNSPAIYLHCACCEDLTTTDYIAGTLGYHQPYASFPASAITGHHDGIPKFPMMLTVASLVGTPSQLSFIIGLLLQTTRDTKRAFLPPLKGSLLIKGAEQPVVRYIWSLFPVAHWAGKGGNFETTDKKENHRKVDLTVLEPGYIEHATNHLKTAYPNSQPGSFAISELTDTLWLDLNTMRDYAHLLRTLSQPYFSTTLVVTLENFDKVEGKPGWNLTPEFQNLEMCYEGILESEGDIAGGKKSCGRLCSRRPESA